MTDKILQEIADRAEAATPGPWRAGIEGNFRVYAPDGMASRSGLVANVFKDRPTVDFIAHARTDIPLLLSELQKARERVEVLETALKPFAVKDLGRQTYGDFDRARQALSPAPVGEEGS